MALAPSRAVRLARTLRNLRESAWPGVELTQAQLAGALSAESRVASATLSSWESLTNPKTPSASRLSAYARFFATRRSLDKTPHLIPLKDLTPDELERYHELEGELLGLLHAEAPAPRNTFSFDEGPVTIICPEVPEADRSKLANPSNPNFNRFQLFGDLDAALEIWGHVRVANPNVTVNLRLAREVVADDLSGHVILLGGIGWNRITRRIQSTISSMPITQVEVPELETGEIFRVKDAYGERSFFPEWDDPKAEIVSSPHRGCGTYHPVAQPLPEQPYVDHLQRHSQPWHPRRGPMSHRCIGARCQRALPRRPVPRWQLRPPRSRARRIQRDALPRPTEPRDPALRVGSPSE